MVEQEGILEMQGYEYISLTVLEQLLKRDIKISEQLPITRQNTHEPCMEYVEP